MNQNSKNTRMVLKFLFRYPGIFPRKILAKLEAKSLHFFFLIYNILVVTRQGISSTIYKIVFVLLKRSYQGMVSVDDGRKTRDVLFHKFIKGVLKTKSVRQRLVNI